MPRDFSAKELETTDGHDWKEVKLCVNKMRWLVFAPTVFCIFQRFGRVFEGPWNEQLPFITFLFAWAGFAYDDSFQKRFYRRISSRLSCMMNLKRNNMKQLFVCWFELLFMNTVPSPKSVGKSHRKSVVFPRLHHPADYPFTSSVPVPEGFRFPSEHPICDGSQWFFKGWQLDLEGTPWAMRKVAAGCGIILSSHVGIIQYHSKTWLSTENQVDFLESRDLHILHYVLALIQTLLVMYIWTTSRPDRIEHLMLASNIARVVLGLGQSIFLDDQWTLLIVVHFSIWWFEFGTCQWKNAEENTRTMDLHSVN